jgi:hypothetical protein
LAFFNGIFGSKRRYFPAFPSFYGVTRLISSLQASWRKIRVRLGLEVVKIKKNDRIFSKISNQRHFLALAAHFPAYFPGIFCCCCA